MDSPLRAPAVTATYGEHVRVRLDGTEKRMKPNDRIGTWSLMGFAGYSGHPNLCVFEQVGLDDGRIAYIEGEEEILSLGKRLEATCAAEEGCYGGFKKHEIVDAPRDLLREKILASAEEPTLDEIRSLLPPIGRAHTDSASIPDLPHAFIGTPMSDDIVAVGYDPRHSMLRVDPTAVSAEISAAVESGSIWEGLVGGWLPVVRTEYRVRETLRWESLQFAPVELATRKVQPVFYRFVRIEDGQMTEARYFDSYLPYPSSRQLNPSEFYGKLASLRAYWQEQLQGIMSVDLPDSWISDFCRHSIVLEMITRSEDHPHYGVITREYGAADHDGFQDILNSSVASHLEWGLFAAARSYLADYFEDFVRDDGSINYRGPEMGQYARMLTNLAMYADFVGDESFVEEFGTKIGAIIRILLDGRQKGTRLPEGDPAYGLVHGRHEADISFLSHQLSSASFERPYFSNTAQAWRALRDFARSYADSGDSAFKAAGTSSRELAEIADQLLNDFSHAIDRSIIERAGERYLPPIAGSRIRHTDLPYRSAPESFDDNRVWAELMHSGATTKDLVRLIMDFQSTHHGTLLGIFTNRRQAVVFQAHGQAYGLIQHDMIQEFLLLYYSILTQMSTRGTWSAYECVDPDRERAEHLPYCVPAQLVAPLATKWMLVFEQPEDSALWLAKATPRKWLWPGNHIDVRSAPTRWGPLSYSISSDLENGVVRATVESPPSAVPKAVLRLRVPVGNRMVGVEINGHTWTGYNSTEESVSFALAPGSKMEVTVRYRDNS